MFYEFSFFLYLFKGAFSLVNHSGSSNTTDHYQRQFEQIANGHLEQDQHQFKPLQNHEDELSNNINKWQPEWTVFQATDQLFGLW